MQVVIDHRIEIEIRAADLVDIDLLDLPGIVSMPKDVAEASLARLSAAALSMIFCRPYVPGTGRDSWGRVPRRSTCCKVHWIGASPGKPGHNGRLCAQGIHPRHQSWRRRRKGQMLDAEEATFAEWKTHQNCCTRTGVLAFAVALHVIVATAGMKSIRSLSVSREPSPRRSR